MSALGFAQTFLPGPNIPLGAIVAWSGSLATIPAGYALCDGTNGTPDLRDRFVVGAGSSFVVGDTGGAATHTHPFTSDGHTHNMEVGAVAATAANVDFITDVNVLDGTSDAADTAGPWYSLAYIMRFS